MKVPFVDLKAQYKAIKSEIDEAVRDVIESTQFVGGRKLRQFEENFASYIEAGYAIGTSSGTSALHLALLASGVGPGDEVITSSHTFIATTEAITHAGAKPVLVDVLEDSLTLDPEKVEEAITPKTKAIIPVHIYGQSADMTAIREIAQRHSLKVVADAAQAHGAKLNGNRKDIQGDLTCFSFYPGKNLGAYGDGGIVVTDNEEIADRVRMLGNHGRFEKYLHLVEGYNYRLDALQAAILDVKLRHLDEWNESRRRAAKRYTDSFDGDKVRPVAEARGRYHVYHLYVVLVDERDKLIEDLKEKGIAAGIHYPVPLHLQKAYRHLGLGKGAFPVSEQACDRMISLPMYPELTDDMVDQVVKAVNEVLS